MAKFRQKWKPQNRCGILKPPLIHTRSCLPLSTYADTHVHAHTQRTYLHPGTPRICTHRLTNTFWTHALVYAFLLSFALVHTSILIHAYFLVHILTGLHFVSLVYLWTQMLSTGNAVSWKKEIVVFLPIKIFPIKIHLKHYLPQASLISLMEPPPSLSPGFRSSEIPWAP